MSAAETVLHYPFSSQLCVDPGQRQSYSLRLATFTDDDTPSPYFFDGHLRRPQRTAELLRALMGIVQARFHIPASMLEKIVAASDPIVTSGEERLRFEGFSACCGVYARIDLLPDALEGESMGRGTTNVDFNPPMLGELAKIGRRDKVSLKVGADEVVLQRSEKEVVEKKVKLPLRWLRGLLEVQSVQQRMKRVHEVNAIEAMRFFRSLPRMKTNRRECWVVRSGQGLRLSQIAAKNGVRVGGLERLRSLERLARDASSLEIYADELTDASAWVMSFDDCRFHLVISPEVWRGFSGEGQALESIVKSKKQAIPKIQAQLKWQSCVDVGELAKATRLRPQEVEDTLKVLGTRGLVGFDLGEGKYFHREMPFDVSEVEKLQPRLVAARRLIEAGNVRVTKQTKQGGQVMVESRDVVHRVSMTSGSIDRWTCTCPWYNKHLDSRGPCKHILAAQIALLESATG